MLRLLVLAGLVATCFGKSCISCICQHESGCRPTGCAMDVGSLSCGYFQIKKPYYIDCGQPGKKSGESTETAWKRCANNLGCAKTCVNNYVNRYRKMCPGVGSCQQMARLHNGGPGGCKRSSTLKYWNAIKNCCKCS